MTKKKPADDTAPATVITGIKAFDHDLKCLDFQFEVGKTYRVDGKVVACKRGFHAIPDDQHPLAVLDYYPPSSRFCEVEQSGETDRDGDKIASASITVKVELGLHDLIARAIKWVFDRAKPECESATGENGAASATGWGGAASATGVRGAASATGENGAASATGEKGAASATGWRGAASATGWGGAASATGVRGAASATGWRGAASATGENGAASATGENGAASATGENGAASATGEKGAASATGWGGAASATGWRGAASATGVHCIAVSVGFEARAMATETNGLCLANRNDDGSIRHLRASKCGENGIESGVWYSLSADGDFVRAEPPL